jgi:hypothetical protein
MNVEQTSASQPTYDRHLLLSGIKRNAVLELWEVQRYGIDSYDDADYVAIYGMRPVEWYAKAVRLLGRTAVECTRRIGRCYRQGSVERPNLSLNPDASPAVLARRPLGAG